MSIGSSEMHSAAWGSTLEEILMRIYAFFLNFNPRNAASRLFSLFLTLSSIIAPSHHVQSTDAILRVDPKVQFGPPNHGPSFPLDISDLRNNKAFGMVPGEANFDGNRFGYPAESLPFPKISISGINYDFPQYEDNVSLDNVIAAGQLIKFTRGKYVSVNALIAADRGTIESKLVMEYADGSTTSSSILAQPFWRWADNYGSSIMFSKLHADSTSNYNNTGIWEAMAWVDSSKELLSIRLPNTEDSSARLHVFALSMMPVSSEGSDLTVQSARSTRNWVDGYTGVQIFEVFVNNVGTEWINTDDIVEVVIDSQHARTVQPGYIKRLRPGDQAVVHVGVVNEHGVEAGSQGQARARLINKSMHVTGEVFDATLGIPQYEAEWSSIYAHEAPTWFNNAKFGIFIHWGLYSVPAWGNSAPNETYAEWYWFNMNEGPETPHNTYQYNLDTYGPDHVYDDFMSDFTASAYDPREWVDLFAAAGAGYFVITTKHHDGFNLFELPESVTKRTSLHYEPKRDIVKELFEASRIYQPQLHLGTYYSMPEWFNPDYADYGFSRQPGGSAKNPYTGELLNYHGHVKVDDYLQDVQLPSMLALADMGTEIMWCDIGGPNLTTTFASNWYNDAATSGRQVVMNNRCGLPGDFDTPEYTTFSTVQKRKWESSRGLDPFSYGYNRATPQSAYMDAEAVIQSLVDMVSKGGNFLLDIGPMANGSIPQFQQDTLREVGFWLSDHGEAIYNTTYWSVAPEEGEHIRFTQSQDAFYIHVLGMPDSTLDITMPVPYLEGDTVTVLGGKVSGTVVQSSLDANGVLQLKLSEEVRESGLYCWTFKISYT